MSENKHSTRPTQANGAGAYDADTGEFFSAEELAQQPQLDTRTYRRMLTMATIGAAPERCKMLNPPKTIPIVLWKGIANGVQDIVDPKNDKLHYTALVGEFEAIVYQGSDPSPEGDSITWYGGLTILPSGFHDALLSQLARYPEDKLTTEGMAFALEFAATPSANPRGYSYIARNMVRVVRRHDRLSMLAIEADRVRRLRLTGPVIDQPAEAAK